VDGGEHHLLRSDHVPTLLAKKVTQPRPVRVADAAPDGFFKLSGGMGIDQPVVVRHELHFVLPVPHAALKTGDDVGAVFGHNVFEREIILEIPGTLHRDAPPVELVQCLDQVADDANVLAEAQFVRGVAAIRVIEVAVKAKGKMYFW
jgi:hypothetical protein